MEGWGWWFVVACSIDRSNSSIYSEIWSILGFSTVSHFILMKKINNVSLKRMLEIITVIRLPVQISCAEMQDQRMSIEA